MMMLIGNFFLILGMFFIVFGSVCILIFPHFYARLLACSSIDTLGMSSILIGLIILHPHKNYIMKIVLIMAFIVLINPVSTYAIGRCAYIRGERPHKEEDHV